MTTYSIATWLSEAELQAIPTSAYWNDEEAERNKPWNVTTGDFEALERHVGKLGLMRQLDALRQKLFRRGLKLAGEGASLAAGVSWLEAQLLVADPGIRHLHCIEFSRHRISTLAPLVMKHSGVSPERVQLCHGSFYDLHLPDGSLDFVLLSQAFHHAHDPRRLLAEIRRVLKPDGIVLVIGEHWFGDRDYVKRLAKHVVKWTINRHGWRKRVPLLPRYQHLYPAGANMGDHFYSLHQYRKMFAEFGFDFTHYVIADSKQQAFALFR